MTEFYTPFFLLAIIIAAIYFALCSLLVRKYDAPKALVLLGLLGFWGVGILLVLIFRPNGYSDKAKRVHCPSCGGLIDREFKICPYCRHSTVRAPGPAAVKPVRLEAPRRRCIHCGGENSSDARFCKQCGTKMS